MAVNEPITMPLLIEQDVRLATELASVKANEMGFDIISSAELALAVSEICQNVIRYGVEGKAVFQTNDAILTITIKDKGPGIENLEQAMKKGYSSLKTSLGVGLDVAKRSVDEFEIQTDTENGTEITLRKFLPISEDHIEYGVVSMSDENYAVNGDDYLIKEFDGDKALLAVIDGTGEGYPAHMAALVVKDYLTTNYRLPLEEIVAQCHLILSQHEVDRGATIALAKIENGFIYYIGIGDTHAYLLGKEISSFHNHEGTIGLHRLPTLVTKKITLTNDTCLILCTDGIKSNLHLEKNKSASAQELANTIFKRFHKEYGDVTVLVANHLKGL